MRETVSASLSHLRSWGAFRTFARAMDIPVPIRIPYVVHPIYVSLSKNVSWVVSRGRGIEEGERNNFVRLLQSGLFRKVADIGANAGVYGFMAANLAGAQVIMVEADSGNADLLQRTITRAGKGDSVKLIRAAASDQSGEVTFYSDDLTGATGSTERAGKDSFIAVHFAQMPVAVTVKAVTVDEICNGDWPDLMKMDVEGAELKVLRGAQRTLKEATPALVFECDQDQPQIHELLAAYGYRFFDMETLLPSTSTMLPHNCLALHPTKHAALIAEFLDGAGHAPKIQTAAARA